MNVAKQYDSSQPAYKLAVVIPCYKVRDTIDEVIQSIPQFIELVYCVDDCCPQHSGKYIEKNHTDPRLVVIYNKHNLGVGGATQAGYRQAIADGADVIVKVDGDGQMDPRLISCFVEPIVNGQADYTKGNRFFWVTSTENMPKVRVFGNGILSFMSKLSSGYWNIFDPTNGYTAIHARVLEKIPYQKVSKNYFFESDMLYQLGLARAVVQDIPMLARYGDEESNLSIRKIVFPFMRGHTKNFIRRIVYMYYLRDFHLASIELLFGSLSLSFGVFFAILKWYESVASGTPTTAGTVMIGGLAIIVGVQMLLGAVNYDIQNVPRNPIHRNLKSSDVYQGEEPRISSINKSIS